MTTTEQDDEELPDVVFADYPADLLDGWRDAMIGANPGWDHGDLSMSCNEQCRSLLHAGDNRSAALFDALSSHFAAPPLEADRSR
ncbi:MAG: hypothetical protein NVS3B18_07970 [Candidatus Dormibacteria bacterium]